MLNKSRLTGADGTLVGAQLTMIDAVSSVVTLIGASLEDALIMASCTSTAFLLGQPRCIHA